MNGSVGESGTPASFRLEGPLGPRGFKSLRCHHLIICILLNPYIFSRQVGVLDYFFYFRMTSMMILVPSGFHLNLSPFSSSTRFTIADGIGVLYFPLTSWTVVSIPRFFLAIGIYLYVFIYILFPIQTKKIVYTKVYPKVYIP